MTPFEELLMELYDAADGAQVSAQALRRITKHLLQKYLLVPKPDEAASLVDPQGGALGGDVS